MVSKWKERGHEAEDHHAIQDEDCVNALRACGLLQFFMIPGIRAQSELLKHLISSWDVDCQLFMFGDKELDIEVIDIYFVTRLSRKGQRVQLSGSRSGGESMNMLIARHCPGAKKGNSKKINIKNHQSSIVNHHTHYGPNSRSASIA